MVSISMSITGDKRAIRRLEILGSRGGSLKGIEPQLWRRFAANEKKLFNTEGSSGPDGRWKALKPATVDTKRRNNQDLRILRADRDLFKSVTVRNNPNAVHRATRDEVHLGTKDPKADFHQRPRGNKRPTRKSVAMTKAQRKEMVADVRYYIVTGSRRGA